MVALTERQERVLRVIEEAIEDRGVVPSYREIAGILGMTSTNGVAEHIAVLIRKGYLERVGDAGNSRSLRLVNPVRENEQIRQVPVVGKVAAGIPLLAVENRRGNLQFDVDMLPKGANLFALQVTGESMIDDGIHDGDMLIVREQSTAHDGEIAVVMVEGEATVKRFFREGAVIRLQPANTSMKPIFLTARSGDIQIIGVVVGLFRRI